MNSGDRYQIHPFGVNGDREDLLHLIDRTLGSLIQKSPHLESIPRRFSEKELKGEVVALFRSLNHGLPVKPPRDFEKDIFGLTESSEWLALLEVLRGWEVPPPGAERLMTKDLESLARGLLWGTILIGGLAS